MGHRPRNFNAAVLVAITMVGALVDRSVRADYTFERVVSGLNQPTFMTQAPGDDNRLFIVERTDAGNTLGRITAYDQQSKTTSTFLDFSGAATGDGGLLSMTFHPDYQANGLFYTVSNVSGTNGLDEWKVVSGEPQLQKRVYEYQNLQNVFHTMNQAFFRPGGDNNELFVTSGDGGTQANSPQFDPALIENPDSPYGKLLRFDLTADYATPAGGASHAGVDVVALGLRNPYRSGFDRTTGDFYIGDVGFNQVEEVDFIPSSHFDNPSAQPLDFGWTDREGTIETVAGQAGGPGSPGDLNPVFEYAHNDNIDLGHTNHLTGGSLTGGYVYRGPVDELQGRYFFTDFLSQRIYSGVFDPATDPANYNGDNFTDLLRHDIEYEDLLDDGTTLEYITSFAEDNQGNLYIVKFGDSFFPSAGQGEIFRIALPSEERLTLTVDRETGAIVLQNEGSSEVGIRSLAISSASGALDTAQLTPIAGNHDASGDMLIDSNDDWQVDTLTPSLFSEGTTGDPGAIGAGVSLGLAPADGWFRGPGEDITASLTLADGSIVDATVTYTGNGGVPFVAGDLDFDNDIDRDDFVVLTQSTHTDLSSLSLAAAYTRGDLTGDGSNDYDDFIAFKNLFIAEHGAAAFASLTTVPEPSTLSLYAATVLTTLSLRRRSH